MSHINRARRRFNQWFAAGILAGGWPGISRSFVQPRRGSQSSKLRYYRTVTAPFLQTGKIEEYIPEYI